MNNNIWICYRSKSRFCVFKSINNDKFYLIYISNPIKGFISYDLIDNKIINKLKNVHDMIIVDIRHFGDKMNKKDFILSATQYNNIKLWNFNFLECLLNLEKVYAREAMYSACFLNDNNLNYIITSNCSWHSGFIKVFDFHGNKIKEIAESNEETIYIDSYYDIKLSQIFIITCNRGHIKSYNYKNNKKFQKYNDEELEYEEFYIDIIIKNEEKLTKLIASKRYNGYIRIWDFHKGNLLEKIEINKKDVLGICLWNNDYLFVGCSDNSIKLIDLKTKKIIKGLFGHNTPPVIISKIIHPNYGECLLSGSFCKILFWESKNLFFDLKKVIKDEYSL